MKTPRENVMEVINWGKPDYVPMNFECFAIVGLNAGPFTEAPLEDGKDAFGVQWHVNAAGAMPDTNNLMLDDITRWREVIQIPDPQQFAAEVYAGAAEELAGVDREKQMVQLFHDTGLFERLLAFMGVENALMAMVEEPEACKDFFDAMGEYRVKCIEILLDAYKPDIFTYFDDVATARGLFMSPDTWRELIKPAHEKIVKAVIDRGVIFQQHVCGLCVDLLDDYLEMGVTMWHSAQIMNDIAALQDKYRGRLVIEGGWDSSGVPGMVSATEEDVRREVRRNMEEYGYKGGFILSPMLMNERGNAQIVGDDRMDVLLDEFYKCSAF